MRARGEYMQTMRTRYREARSSAAKAAVADEITLVTG